LRCCCFKGYPDEYKKGFEISGLDFSDEEIIVYHAGTKKENKKILTNGGRVLGITSIIKNYDLKLAKQKAYDALSKISFDGMYYRNDIAEKAFKYLK
jgi:phosphoribosylamine--glycine ligase